MGRIAGLGRRSGRERAVAASLSLLPRTLDAPGDASSVVAMRLSGAVGFGTRSPYGGSLSKSESSPGSNSPSHSRLASLPGSNSPSHSLLVSSPGSNSPSHSLLASSLGSNSHFHSLLASSPSPPNSSEIPTSFRPFSDRFSSPTIGSGSTSETSSMSEFRQFRHI